MADGGVLFSGDMADEGPLAGLVWMIADCSADRFPSETAVLFAVDAGVFVDRAMRSVRDRWRGKVSREIRDWKGMFSEVRIMQLAGAPAGSTAPWESLCAGFCKEAFPLASTVMVDRRGATMKSRVVGGVYLGRVAFITGDHTAHLSSPRLIPEGSWVMVPASGGVVPAADEARGEFDRRMLEGSVAGSPAGGAKPSV